MLIISTTMSYLTRCNFYLGYQQSAITAKCFPEDLHYYAKESVSKIVIPCFKSALICIIHYRQQRRLIIAILWPPSSSLTSHSSWRVDGKMDTKFLFSFVLLFSFFLVTGIVFLLERRVDGKMDIKLEMMKPQPERVRNFASNPNSPSKIIIISIIIPNIIIAIIFKLEIT